MFAKEREWRRTAGSREEILRLARSVPDQQFCTMSPNRTARGDYVLLIEGARYDPAVSAEAHVALLVLRVEESISDDAECDAHARILVLVDVRPNAGWINAPGARLIPFVRKIAATIPPYYPERLRSLAVYPVPWLLVWVFTACTGTFLDKRTRAKVSMLAGPNYADSPCPVELADIATYEVIPIHCRQRYEALRIPAA
ncbi:hypothetical protein M885DRAFT_507288 [Pelagophyceae sp. CCMP2097]|nr:hypothetical protein M885DRAFT_507288 [Pelagophyceae sp. CCMP2097]